MRYKPSKTKIREFAKTMDSIYIFCTEHGIGHSASMDSYYFTVRGQAYRVSNHTIEASNRGAYSDLGQTRELYHSGREENTIYIHAGKTRLIEIYNHLVAGYVLDGRGNIKS